MERLRREEAGGVARHVTRWLPWLIWLGIAAGAVALVLIATHRSRERVPGVVGSSRSSAVERLERASLRARVIEISGGTVAGRVTRQEPRSGVEVEEGATVTLLVSRGPQGTPVPDVSRLRPGAARQALERAGFWVRTAHAPSAGTPAGRVLGTSPAATSRLGVGAQVTVLVSTGRPRARVPSVQGLSRSEAERRLLREGFRVVIVRRESLDPPGAVISQSPAAGERTRSRAVVRVGVAARPEPATVPAVTGLAFERAVEIASAAGFAIDFAHRKARRPEEIGQVLAQDPPGRERAPRGAHLRITVGVAR